MRSPPTFSKWHALGNVYWLVERADLAVPLTAERVRELCSDGAADGVLEVADVRGDDADVVVWNPDGSTAELSGNGTRIAARWLADRTGAGEVRIRVGPRVVSARIRGDEVEQDLGEVEVYERERVAGLDVTSVSVGNPHAVVEGDPDDLPLIGPLLETHPRFPNRTNVQVARLEREGEITARVWERGVGETSASGTSAVAVAAALGQNPAAVRFPGGTLHVRFEGSRAFLTGPAERLADDGG
ncbi:MAG TPA: diaminopimelate epimerase [Gaiellaceae bacterium]